MADASTDAVATIVDRYSGDVGMLIPMMQDIQEEFGYLPPDALRELAREARVPLSRIFGIATFYAMFRLAPKGDHTIQLCMGTVCFLKGAGKISDALQEEFGLVPGGTTPDGKFTFSPVNCLGACALAPVMTVDGEYHGGLSVESAVGLLRSIAGAEAPAEAKPEPEKAPENAETKKATKAPKTSKTRTKTKVKAKRRAGKKSGGKGKK